MSLASEEEAQRWLRDTFPSVPRETWDRIAEFAAFLQSENERQNLVARNSLHTLWVRHIADSAQLARAGDDGERRWLDLGSGAGFPGLIVAALTGHHVTLVESRRLRVEFLQNGAEILRVAARTEVIGRPLERIASRSFDIISARAFAPLDRLLALAHRFSTEKTLWLLPKGRSAVSELEQVSGTWQGDFKLEDSLTDPDAKIIVATNVRPRHLPGKRS